MSREKDVKVIWLDEGLKILAAKGPAFLSIENLTAATGKTKGSFYHHFSSREQYVKQLLEYHEKKTIDEINEVVDKEDLPRARLKKLTKLAFQISQDIELVIRAWALYDPAVKTYQDRMDKRRLDYVRNLHISSGVQADKAHVLSYRDHSLFLGLQQLRHRLNDAQLRKILKGIYSNDVDPGDAPKKLRYKR